ncbi:MAG: 16S rRNA (cytosine(967)-C(5))-methyltransferase RsmB, partial [Clostridia bacterium]
YSPKPYAPKPYGDKPQGDKPAYSPKPYAPKPYGDKPQGDKPAYTPKPYAPKPYGDRPQGDKPAYSPKPYAPKPYGDRPQGDKPAYSPKPYAPKPPIGAPRVDQATEAKPAFDKPRTFAKPRSFDKPRHGDKPANAPKQGMGMDSRKLALLALSDVVRGKAYSQLALDERLRASSISPEDKRLSTMIFYAALENRLRISWVLKQFVESMPEDVVEDIFHIAAAQLLFLDRVPDHAVVDEAVKQVKALGREHFAPLVNGTLRTLIRARNAEEIRYPVKEDDEVKYLSVMHSLPEALSARLIADYGMEEAEQMIAYRPDEHTQTVRPNLSKMDDAQFEQYLTERGWSPRKGIVPHAFHITAAGDLGSDPAFREGLFSMQGEGSMLPCYAMAPRPGETILDCCAAPGGKAALLSELMGETGRVQAWELHEHRAELMRAMKKRLRLDNLRIAVRDATISREECVGEFDAVLVDAPCSGLGVMVNKPDIKYRVTEDDITLLTQLQKKILDACAPYVRVGGRLVYATCTVIKDENERQAAAFLERHPEFMADPDGSWLPEALRERFHDGQIQLQAHKDQMEGFFVARFVRTEGSR